MHRVAMMALVAAAADDDAITVVLVVVAVAVGLLQWWRMVILEMGTLVHSICRRHHTVSAIRWWPRLTPIAR
jgi:hypothetical protein